ncbi:hypothetical protein GA0115240_10942 [Streptomyces sp. DvalAA-14]|uniref:hypothetical protein n=1 Tax=unclassified Streptomyces TaxID=2593676 RepID=UPI00081BB71D|nr:MULTISPECIES: hypothetical protein [unclassified Streptomyces]MYS19493.1 hypothetical protein [Streptomyces sp. SID4948]SCD45858.1 hypothetical protein GA0115240_10942 [Streptomyces sp. DvalAA-14]
MALARWRMAGLYGAVLVLGSPWAQHGLQARHGPHALYEWARGGLSTCTWFVSASQTAGLGTRWMWSADASLVLMLAAGALLVPRALRRAPAGPLRWAVAIGIWVPVSLAGQLAFWLFLGRDARLFGPRDFLLVTLLDDGAVFGVLAGLVTGLLWIGADRPARPAVTARARHLERSRAMTLPPDSSPTALGREPGDVTRYLCAAAYTDPAFARTVANGLLADAFGAVAPSPGVDLGPVVRHCLAARRLHRRRDVRLSAALLAILLIAPLWPVLTAGILGVLGAAARPPAGALADRGRDRSKEPAAWLKAGVAYGVALIAGGWLAVGLSSHGPGVVRWLLGTYLGGFPALLVLCVGLPAVGGLVARHLLDVEERLRGLRRSVFVPSAAPLPDPVPAWLADRLRVIDEAQSGNVTVYSGWEPALGFAARQSGWSLALPVVPAGPPPGVTGPPGEVTAFDAWDLLESLRGHLRELSRRGGAPGAGDGALLAGLAVEDRVFVHGATIAGDDRFLPDTDLAPSLLLDREEMRRVVLEPKGTARHSLVAHLPLWGGDVVPAVLLRVAVSERTVHVECAVHTLAPVRGGYHRVDSVPDRMTGQRRAELLLSAVGRAGRVLRAAPYASVENLRFGSRRWRREMRELRAISEDPDFDYGARLSVRERAMNPTYLNYFQVLDAQRVTAAVTRHTLTVIREFLDAHGVDTADFQRQQQTILNHGVLQQGGLSVVGNQAVGQEASATLFAQSPAPPTPTA